jgi:hypothetical protein
MKIIALAMALAVAPVKADARCFLFFCDYTRLRHHVHRSHHGRPIIVRKKIIVHSTIIVKPRHQPLPPIEPVKPQ